MTEGSVVKWLKTSGETVEKGELLLIVQTDKVEIEIESPYAGTMGEILVELDQAVPVGTVICKIVGDSSPDPSVLSDRLSMSTTGPQQVEPLPQGSPENSAPTVLRSPRLAESGLASPRAKKVARDLGIDIALVPDYNGRGRIVEEDVRRFFHESPSERSTSVASSQVAESKASGGDATTASRKIVAERMTLSFRTIPHFYLGVLADTTELTRVKERLADSVQSQLGVRPSYTDFLLKALAIALQMHPNVNVQWQGAVVAREHINVGFATQTSDRLVVPVIRNANQLPIAELAKRRRELVARAQSGKLQLGDAGDASCTLSNLGSYRVDSFNAIINPSESLILAAGRIALRPIVVNGAIVARQTIYLTLSVDHRVLDGSTAADFLSSLVSILENPDPRLQS
jgi:pyruvate dehydrogenase E2 component (dihydrolipoamide acetyltransferase)